MVRATLPQYQLDAPASGSLALGPEGRPKRPNRRPTRWHVELVLWLNVDAAQLESDSIPPDSLSEKPQPPEAVGLMSHCAGVQTVDSVKALVSIQELPDTLKKLSFRDSSMFALRPVCLWPGLPTAWLLGVARGLAVSLVFTWCVCWLLLATFVWSDWISVSLLRLMWLVAIATWFTSTIRNCLRLPTLLATADTVSSQAFVEAQADYLHGNWFEAEAKLLRILRDHPRDAEALLLLVGVLRRAKRFPAAARRLGQLELLDTAARWHFEIEREKVLIEQSRAEEGAEGVESEGRDEIKVSSA